MEEWFTSRVKLMFYWSTNICTYILCILLQEYWQHESIEHVEIIVNKDFYRACINWETSNIYNACAWQGKTSLLLASFAFCYWSTHECLHLLLIYLRNIFVHSHVISNQKNVQQNIFMSLCQTARKHNVWDCLLLFIKTRIFIGLHP